MTRTYTIYAITGPDGRERLARRSAGGHTPMTFNASLRRPPVFKNAWRRAGTMFANLRREPLGWTAWSLGWALNKVGEAVSASGVWIMVRSLARIIRRGL